MMGRFLFRRDESRIVRKRLVYHNVKDPRTRERHGDSDGEIDPNAW